MSLVGSRAVPVHGLRFVLLHTLPMLVHPPELVCRVAVPLRGRFVKPVSSLGIIGWRALAVLKHVADVFFGGVVAMFCGFVAPGESFVVIDRKSTRLNSSH